MKKFDINNYQGKYVMHCKTEEEAKTFCEYLDSIGKRWCYTNERYPANTKWNMTRDRTCYNFNDDMYCDIDWYREHKYTILEFSDFLWSNEFTKDDLKDGMVVEYRSGDRCLVVRDHLLSKEYCINMSDLGDDLKDIYGYQEDDIVKVYDADYTYVDEFEEVFDTDNLTLIWEREEEKKEPDHKEMTVEEIEEKLGYKIKVVADK